MVLKGYVSRPGRYQFKPGMRVSDSSLSYDNLLPDYYHGMAEILRLEPPDYQPGKITIDLDKALAGDSQQNILLKDFDEIRLFSRQEMVETPEVLVSGAVLNPGTYRLYQGMTIKYFLVSAGNLKRSAYRQEAELTRYTPSGKTTQSKRIVLDLEKALAGEPSQNIPLQPEDHLFVRSIPDYALRRTVVLSGKVLFPGTYTIVKGEKLSSVLARAGGFAEGAYLRGAVFTREAVKDIQQERLQKLIFEQEQEISRAAAEIPAQGALSPEELQSAQAVLASRKALVDKLKQMPVTGRMVVHLSPLDKFKESAFNIEVMDGDTLTVPENPKSVTVLGQVYNPISLAYQSGEPVAFLISTK